jgi:small subunit ribosomal protein S9
MSKKVANDIKVSGKYFYAVGRRKSASATVRVYEKGSGKIYINGLTLEEYFPRFELQQIITDVLGSVGHADSHDITVHVDGGGKKGQADSIKLGVARALTVMDAELRDTLKKSGFLRRDPRKKERKKPGLKRARRAPQWSKR